MSETTTETRPARFALDEDKAREWLTRAVQVYEDGETPGDDEHLPGLGAGFDPREYDCTGQVDDLVWMADAAGIIDGPGSISWDASHTEDGTYYSWLVRVGRVTVTGGFEKLWHIGAPDLSGAEAALEVLGEAVAVANGLLDDLAAYATASTPDVLGALWDAASDYEAEMVSELARKAGVLWQCQAYPRGDFCGYDNRADETTCGGCGTAREDTTQATR